MDGNHDPSSRQLVMGSEVDHGVKFYVTLVTMRAITVENSLCAWGTQKKMSNLFEVDENSIEQYFAANIVSGC